MFDYYRPNGDLRCPVCQQPLQEWQGKDGPNALFVWVEGTRTPVEQCVDEEIRSTDEVRARLRLPPRFEIYSYDCADHHPVEADCVANDGVWTGTVVRPFPRK